jgi:hypothetical protein
MTAAASKVVASAVGALTGLAMCAYGAFGWIATSASGVMAPSQRWEFGGLMALGVLLSITSAVALGSLVFKPSNR